MALLVLLPIIPFVVLVAWQADWVRDRAAEDAQLDTLRFSRLAAENVSAQIGETVAVMQLSGGLDADALAGPTTCAPSLAAGVPAVESVVNAFVVTGDGHVLCSLDTMPSAGAFPAGHPMLDAVAAGEAWKGIEPPGAVADRPTLVVTEPLSSGPSLAVALDLSAGLVDFADRYALPAGSTVTLIAEDGRVFGSWPADPTSGVIGPREIVGLIGGGSIEGWTVEAPDDGVDRVYSFVDITRTDASTFAVVGIPTSWGLEPANHEQRMNLLALSVIALITITAAAVLAERWINRHLRAISSTTRRIGAGDLDARVGQRRAPTELAELAATFDEMAADIQARDSALRQAWAERSQLADELLDVQEDERRRIAADIHDDTIQTVAACGMSAQLLRSRLPDPDAIDQLDQLSSRLSAATVRLRRLTFDLDPAANGLALAEGLERYVRGALDGAAVQLMVAADVDDELQGPVRQVVYRNVREAALNAVSHGHATRVDVRVAVDGDGLRVDVVDDGGGFDAGGRGPVGHQGVRTMRHRAEALGGWFDLSSRIGHSTRVTFWVPLAASPGPFENSTTPGKETVHAG